MKEIKIKLTRGAKLPEYATEGSAAVDLCAANEEPITLLPGQRALIPTGIALSIPQGYVGIVAASSGLACKKGICLSNGIGVIDSDYRGEISVGLFNTSSDAFTVECGERIAQLMFMPFESAVFIPTNDLDKTERGEGGFGSTGTR